MTKRALDAEKVSPPKRLTIEQCLRKEEYEEAARLSEELIVTGSIPAKYLLGWLCYHKLGNIPRGLELYQSAARENYAPALLELGLHHDQVTKNYRQMKTYYLQAMLHGRNNTAPYRMALYYWYIKKKYSLAKHYLLLVREDHSDALLYLAEYYRGQKPKVEKCLYYLQRACQAGGKRACVYLFNHYRVRNPALAERYLQDGVAAQDPASILRWVDRLKTSDLATNLSLLEQGVAKGLLICMVKLGNYYRKVQPNQAKMMALYRQASTFLAYVQVGKYYLTIPAEAHKAVSIARFLLRTHPNYSPALRLLQRYCRLEVPLPRETFEMFSWLEFPLICSWERYHQRKSWLVQDFFARVSLESSYFRQYWCLPAYQLIINYLVR